jgi:hypothetical protein
MNPIKVLLVLVGMLWLSSCSQIKRSANEEVFDAKGFQAKKRPPTYNAKYIERAQKNLASDDEVDQQEEELNVYYEQDELPSYQKRNRNMYDDMAYMNQNKQHLSDKKLNQYPKLKDFDTSVVNNDSKLRQEVEEMKKQLEETRQQLAKYKCLGGQDGDGQNQVIPKATEQGNKQDPISSLLESLKPSGKDSKCSYIENK